MQRKDRSRMPLHTNLQPDLRHNTNYPNTRMATNSKDARNATRGTSSITIDPTVLSVPPIPKKQNMLAFAAEERAASYQHAYSPLPTGSIRVLHLQPGKRHKAVRYELVVVDLELAPYYEAVSYAWGYLRKQKKIVLNGQPAMVGLNLFKCLQDFRHETDRRTLWVDVLSINQSDTKEKSAQIDLMPRIYSMASRTLI